LSKLNNALRWISNGLAILALAAGIALLIGDAILRALPRLPAAAISAAPLLLVGTSFLILQPVLRPGFADLLKNALLAATFLLWGFIQFIPQNSASLWLGNLVIVLYVLDLAWVVLGTRITPNRN
jgi:hypothetical protein